MTTCQGKAPCYPVTGPFVYAPTSAFGRVFSTGRPPSVATPQSGTPDESARPPPTVPDPLAVCQVSAWRGGGTQAHASVGCVGGIAHTLHQPPFGAPGPRPPRLPQGQRYARYEGSSSPKMGISDRPHGRSHWTLVSGVVTSFKPRASARAAASSRFPGRLNRISAASHRHRHMPRATSIQASSGICDHASAGSLQSQCSRLRAGLAPESVGFAHDPRSRAPAPEPSEAVVPAGHYRWRASPSLADLRQVLKRSKRALPAPEAFDRHVGAATSIIAA